MSRVPTATGGLAIPVLWLPGLSDNVPEMWADQPSIWEISVELRRRLDCSPSRVSLVTMAAFRKLRKSVPFLEPVVVNIGEVNVVVEGLDCSGITGSFAIHLHKDGERIDSRFFMQPSETAEDAGSGRRLQRIHVDFLLPIEQIAGGKLEVEIELHEAIAPGEPPLSDRIGNPTLSVYLMLDSACMTSLIFDWQVTWTGPAVSSPRCDLLLPTARAAGTRKEDNADSLAGPEMVTGHSALCRWNHAGNVGGWLSESAQSIKRGKR